MKTSYKIPTKKIPYIHDHTFYSLWTYANSYRLTGEKLISFIDILPITGEWKFSTYFFLTELEDLNLKLENINFKKDIYKKLYLKEYNLINKFILRNPNTVLSRSFKKLFKNEATFEDILEIFGKTSSFFKINQDFEGLYEYTQFTSTPSKKNLEPLINKLDDYINGFIIDELYDRNFDNFYLFYRQKEIFLFQLENKIKNYGLEFSFNQGDTIYVNSDEIIREKKDESYLFIHIIVALEKQKLLEIKKISIIGFDELISDFTNEYKVKIQFNKNPLNSRPDKNETNISEIIKVIECIKCRTNTNKLKIIINNNYTSPLEMKRGKYWSKFYELADKQQINNEKGVFDYFNSNLKNPIYSKLKYKQTQILKFDGAACIIPNIKIDIISEKTFTQRKNKAA